MKRFLVVLLILVGLLLAVVWLGLAAREQAGRLWERLVGGNEERRAAVEIGDRVGRGQRTGYLGAELLEVTAELRRFLGGPEDAGVLVAAVAAEGPAAAAGLAAGDLVTRLDGRRVRSAAGLSERLAELPGSEVELEVYRRGERRTARVEVGERVPRRPYLRYRDGDLFDLAERIREAGEKAGVLGELGGVADGVARMDPEAITRALNGALDSVEGLDARGLVTAVEKRLEELERRLEELEAPGRDDATDEDRAAGDAVR